MDASFNTFPITEIITTIIRNYVLIPMKSTSYDTEYCERKNHWYRKSIGYVHKWPNHTYYMELQWGILPSTHRLWINTIGVLTTYYIWLGYLYTYPVDLRYRWFFLWQYSVSYDVDFILQHLYDHIMVVIISLIGNDIN